MSIIKESPYESATYFCIWFYQSRRGKLHIQSDKLDEAKEVYINLFEDYTAEEQYSLAVALLKLIKESSCLERLKSIWKSIGRDIEKIIQEFIHDDSINLSEDEKILIVNRCNPTFLTSSILDDDEELESFIKLYYDIEKQNRPENGYKISDYTGIKEEHIVWIIKDYLYFQSNTEKEHVKFGYKVPVHEDIVHLLHIYNVHCYRRKTKMPAIFKKIFTKDISFSKLTLEPFIDKSGI